MKKLILFMIGLLITLAGNTSYAQTRPSYLQLKDTPVVDIRTFGANTNNTSAANYTAITNAIASVEATGGTLFVPTGEFEYTPSLDIPYNVSIKGCGIGSILKPVTCDGLTLEPHSYVTPYTSGTFGVRTLEDFTIEGDWTTPAYIGIKFEGSDLLGPRIIGTKISRLGVFGFDIGVQLKNSWYTTVSKCEIRCINGIHLLGQNIKTTVADNSMIMSIGAGVSTLTDTYGCYVNAYTYPASGDYRAEDVQITHNLLFGFDYGVSMVTVLHCVIKDNDVDSTSAYGILLSTIGGKAIIVDNWVAMKSGVASVTAGIAAGNRAAIDYGLTIRGNYVVLGNTASAPSAIGLYNGGKHWGTNILENTVVGFPTGIKSFNSLHCDIKGNTILTATDSIYVDYSSGVIADNLCDNRIYCISSSDFNIHGNTNTTSSTQIVVDVGAVPADNYHIGANAGLAPTRIVDEVTLGTGVSSATIPLTDYGSLSTSTGVRLYIESLTSDIVDAGLFATVDTTEIVVERTTTSAPATIRFVVGTEVYPR